MADGPRPDDDHSRALAQATELYATGQGPRALELLPDLVAARPDDIAVRVLLARCLATAGVPAVALAAADAAVTCDPTSWEAHALLARAALATDPERAAIAADRAVQLAPHEPEAGRIQTAVDAARRAATSEKPNRRTGLGSALGRRSSPVTTDLALDPPRLEPRLPAALEHGVEPPPSVEPRLPAALDPARAVAPVPAPAGSIIDRTPSPAREPAPAPTPAARPPVVEQAAPTSFDPGPDATPTAAPVAPVETSEVRRDEVAPILPASLGGVGLAGTALQEDARPAGEEGLSPFRRGFRVVGLAVWLYVGFRYGVQVIGGPLGYALFLGVAAGVALGARQVNRT